MNTTTETYLRDDEDEDEDILYQKDASISAELDTGDPGGTGGTGSQTESEQKNDDTLNNLVTTQSPNLEQKVPLRSGTQGFTESLKATDIAPCTLDCGIGGVCVTEGVVQRCQCPLGRGGDSCENGKY